MAKIIYSPERHKPFPRKTSLILNSVFLNPGENQVSNHQLALLMSYDNIEEYIKDSIITIVKDNVSTEPLGATKRASKNPKTIEASLDNDQQQKTDIQ